MLETAGKRNNQKAKKWLARCLLILALCACSEVIDLDTKGVASQLVIYGRITDGTAGNEVSIALTSPFNGEQQPVAEAQVRLIENGQEIASYVEYTPGKYRLTYSDSARVGRTYQLSVVLQDGRSFLSLPAVMPDQAAEDQLYFDASAVETVVNQAGNTIERNLVQLFTNTRVLDQEKDFYLRWNITEAYVYEERIRPPPPFEGPPPPCYITNDITGQQAMLFNGAEIKVPVISDLILSSTEIDSRFAFAYYFSVIQTTMDEAAYEYWKLIDEISNVEGSIFDRPAAPVPGNFRNTTNPDEEVLGYFEVVRSDTSFVRVRSDDIPFFVQIPCPFAERPREPPSCTDCILLDNSSYHRPYYWLD
jgi:hypothetical protein